MKAATSTEFKNVHEFFTHHYKTKDIDHQRLGQRFVNHCIKHPWPELFYSVDDTYSKQRILTWLADHSYVDSFPAKLNLS